MTIGKATRNIADWRRLLAHGRLPVPCSSLQMTAAVVLGVPYFFSICRLPRVEHGKNRETRVWIGSRVGLTLVGE